MALTQAERTFILNSAQVARTLLDNEGKLDQINVLWAGAPDYHAGITQGDIDSYATFAGLTTDQLADAEFALASILTTIKNALPALTVLGNIS